MSITTNIQWCDSALNVIMGCLGCELYPTPQKLLAAIDRTCLLAGISGWTKGTAKSLFGEVLAQVWVTLEESETGPGLGHQNGLSTTNLRHLRRRMKRRASELFSTKAGRLIQATIEKSLKCYAAQLHANRGFDLENPQRKVNVGYAPTFETITRFPGRTKVAAHWSDLTGIERDRSRG